MSILDERIAHSSGRKRQTVRCVLAAWRRCAPLLHCSSLFARHSTSNLRDCRCSACIFFHRMWQRLHGGAQALFSATLHGNLGRLATLSLQDPACVGFECASIDGIISALWQKCLCLLAFHADFTSTLFLFNATAFDYRAVTSFTTSRLPVHLLNRCTGRMSQHLA